MSPRPNASSLNRQGHEATEWVMVQIPVQLPLVILAQAGIQRLTNRFSRGGEDTERSGVGFPPSRE